MKLKTLSLLIARVVRAFRAVKDIATVVKSAGPCDQIIDDVRAIDASRGVRDIKITNAGKFGRHERRESKR